MIALPSKLPLLQVGTHQLSNYDTEWLLEAIQDALREIEIQDLAIAKDIYRGLLYYLENECSWKPLSIEALYAKLDALLGKIGFPKAQGRIPRYLPEVRISVLEQFRPLNCQLELALFSTLRTELDQLRELGVRKVMLEDVIETVDVILPRRRWNKQCHTLHDEIRALESSFNTAT